MMDVGGRGRIPVQKHLRYHRQTGQKADSERCLVIANGENQRKHLRGGGRPWSEATKAGSVW